MTSVERDSSGIGSKSYGAYAQTEFDFRLESGSAYFRLDWDLQFASNGAARLAAGYTAWPYWTELDYNPELGEGVKFGPPEWAMLQLTFDPFKLRLGIVTHQIGFEDWDSWNTYFPSKSTSYNFLSGRMAGVEPAYTFENGVELFAFTGCDLDWGGCIPYDADGDGVNEHEAGDGFVAGAGVTTLQEFFGTWSGISVYPTIPYYLVAIAVEFYPLEALSVAVDGATGSFGVEDEAGEVTNNFFLGGTLTANVLPAEIVHPIFRFQGLIDPDDGAWGGFYPKISGSAGLTTSPFPGFKISVEGKASRYGEDIVPGFYTSITMQRPEPPPYTAKYPEEAEAAAPEAPAAPPTPAPAPPESGRLRRPPTPALPGPMAGMGPSFIPGPFLR